MTGRTKGLLARSAGLLVVSGALISAGPAFGQGATDQTTAQTGQTGSSADTLQEVVVTAERRAENIQTTPISVIAVSGSDLQAASVANVSSLQQVAPSLTVESESGTGSVLVNIRGIGVEPIGADAVAGVVMVRDGVVNNNTGFGMEMPFYDMADVEVLRGPQGTFQGDNSTGGAIIINSQNPNFRGINGFISGKVATYSDTALQGAVNLPVTDTLAMRVAFNEEQRGSYFYDLGSAQYGPSEGGPFLIPEDSAGCPGLVASEPNPPYPASKGSTLFNQPLNFCGTSAASRKTGQDPGNVNNKDIRLGLLWRPSDNFQSLTKIEIDNQDTDGEPAQPNVNTFSPLKGQTCVYGISPTTCTEAYYSGYSGSPYVLNSEAPQEYNEAISMYSEELRYTFSGGTVARLLLADTEIGDDQLASSTNDSINIQTPDPTTYPITSNENTSTFKEHGYNAEIDFISPTDRKWSWVAGAAWTYTSNQFASFDPDASTLSGYSPSDLGVIQWVDGETIYAKDEGIFGQTTWQMTKTLQFQIGAHVGWDVDTGFGALAIGLGSQPNGQPLTAGPGGPNIGPLILLALGGYNNDQVEAGDNAVLSGKVGFNWQPVQNQYFYVFWARGYKPGLGNLGLVPPTTKEEVNDSEAGWKGTFAQGHLVTQLGGYYMNYYNLQESIFNPFNVAGTADANIAYSSVSGLEASLQTQVAGFGADLSASLNRSVLGHTVTAATYAFPAYFDKTNQCTAATGPSNNAYGPGAGSNCTDYEGIYTGVSYMRDLSGESLPYSPRFQANATIKYAIPFDGGNMSLQPRLTYAYVGVSYAALFQIPYYELPAHGLLNAYLDWNAGPWTTTLFSTNVANKLYVTNIGNDDEYYGDPRVLGLQFTRTF